ncbi:MAG: Fur family transcriptional regulator [bacterium]|nr:transcriptional repressor [Candidatus Margulisiibacteriota bacterium]
MKSFQEILAAKGIRPSVHRLKILEYLDKEQCHPTVDNIYEALIKDLPTISKTTIYNTLKLFINNGLVSDLTISGYDVRYDREMKPHSHFLCKECGEIFDIEEVKCPCLSKEVEGNKVEEVHLYFKGVCKKCQKRGKRK